MFVDIECINCINLYANFLKLASYAAIICDNSKNDGFKINKVPCLLILNVLTALICMLIFLNYVQDTAVIKFNIQF